MSDVADLAPLFLAPGVWGLVLYGYWKQRHLSKLAWIVFIVSTIGALVSFATTLVIVEGDLHGRDKRLADIIVGVGLAVLMVPVILSFLPVARSS